MTWVAIVERQRAGCGRDNSLIYEHVLTSVRQIKVDANTFVTQNPEHPWADPLFKEFIVDIPDAQAEAVRDGSQPLFYDGLGNLPRWQQATDGSGSTYNPGSFVDPTDHHSAFVGAVPLPDDRWIVRLYDNDPETTGVHIASLDLDEDQDGGTTTIYLKLFNSNDTPSAINVQNSKTEIAGKLMIFDFTNGVTTFGVDTTGVGHVVFASTGKFRVIGPGGQKSALFRVFGRTLTAR